MLNYTYSGYLGGLKMIHIVFKQSAFGSLRYLLKGTSEKIIEFPAFLAEGPIYHLLTERGLNARLQWLEKCYDFNEEDIRMYKEQIELAIHQISAIPNDEQVIIWTCENANEQIGLRVVLELLKNSNVSIYIGNTYFNMLKIFEHKDIQIEIRHSGEVNAQQYAEFIHRNMFEQVTTEGVQCYVDELNGWLANDAVVRTWIHGKMRFDDATRDDAWIIQYAKELHGEQQEVEFFPAARLVGQVLGMSEYDISDTWIEYRLRHLIEQGFFCYEGDLSEMRKYRVRLNEK